uniref:Metalloendopeptidase n=1 Tax=Acrobeloides nanus TaxID=290746 RepID=A0A914C8J8_9BILA
MVVHLDVNEPNDKTTPVVEIPSSSESFSSKRNRREVFDVNFRSDELENGQHGRNALYNRGFFEGDIATNGLSSNTIKEFLVNEFYDKTIPEAEIPLSFSSIRNRREVFEINFKVGEESGPSNRNALYNRGYFEGDIATNGLSSNTIKEFLGEINAPRGVSRNAVRNPAEKWPKNGEHVLIPVAYSSQYTQKFIYKIERAMREFHNRTCIRFIPKTSSHIDYIYVTPEKFCHSEVGRKGGKQILSLTGECIRGSEGVGAIIHELMHTIGFYHEQSRADRNNYVTIHLENVLDDAKGNFDTYDLEKITHLGTSYDYESILHYDMYAFSKNGLPTIVPTKPGVTIGQRRGFSSIDVYKINKLYECWTNTELQQSISSSCPTQYSNLDIVENNLFHKPGEISDCCNFCTATKGCRAYAWSYYIGGMCTLKSALGPTISNPTIKMGILNSGGTCTKQIGTDIIEQVLAYRVGEEYQCCDFCKETKGCEAYTFDQYDGGMCWLKHADVPLVRKDGIKSGINAQEFIQKVDLSDFLKN